MTVPIFLCLVLNELCYHSFAIYHNCKTGWRIKFYFLPQQKHFLTPPAVMTAVHFLFLLTLCYVWNLFLWTCNLTPTTNGTLLWLPVDGTKFLARASLTLCVQHVSGSICAKSEQAHTERCPLWRVEATSRLFQRQGEGILCLEAILGHHTFILVPLLFLLPLLFLSFKIFIFIFICGLSCFCCCWPIYALSFLRVLLWLLDVLMIKWKYYFDSPGLPFKCEENDRGRNYKQCNRKLQSVGQKNSKILGLVCVCVGERQ